VLSVKHLAVAAKPATYLAILQLMTTTKKGAFVIALLIGAGTTAIIVSKAKSNSSADSKNGSSMTDSSLAQSVPNPATSTANRARIRQEDDKTFSDLNDKYGASQTRAALKAAASITSLSEAYYSSLTPDEKTLQEKSNQTMESLAETLQLDEDHTKAVVGLSRKYAETTKQLEAAIIKQGHDNVKPFAETLLALDAWKQDKSNEAEFREVFDRNWPQLSVDRNSILEGAEIYSQSTPETDPLQNMDKLAGEILQLLPQETADRYREMRARNAEGAKEFTFVPKTVEEVAKFADDSKRLIEAMGRFDSSDK